MLSFLLFIFFIWIFGGFIKFAFRATWGLFKIIGFVLAIFAFPLLFVSVFLGIGAIAILPIVLIVLAFGCIAKAA